MKVSNSPIRIWASLLPKLTALSEKTGMPVSKLVNMAVAAYLEKYSIKDGNVWRLEDDE